MFQVQFTKPYTKCPEVFHMNRITGKKKTIDKLFTNSSTLFIYWIVTFLQNTHITFISVFFFVGRYCCCCVCIQFIYKRFWQNFHLYCSTIQEYRWSNKLLLYSYIGNQYRFIDILMDCNIGKCYVKLERAII